MLALELLPYRGAQFEPFVRIPDQVGELVVDDLLDHGPQLGGSQLCDRGCHDCVSATDVTISGMKITVLGFATAAEALGRGAVEVELAAGSGIADLRRHLEGIYPELVALWPRLAVAVDGSLVGGDAPLTDGAEVALLPPVSGGSGAAAPEAGPETVDAAGPPGGDGITGLADGPLDVAAATAAVAGPARGAVVVFLGTVRDHHQGRPVERLTYSAYRPMAAAVLRRIVADLEAAAPGLRAAIVHRLGEVPVGEASVVIAIASPHRAAAYEASRTALERLKKEAPIWKREHYAGGASRWREEEPLAAR